MVPAPAVASPPLTDHMTPAAPPVLSLAENWCTGLPCALVALQPVQLVSMDVDPGEIEKVAFAGLAVTAPPPHPASKTMAEPRRARKSLTNRPRTPPATGVTPGSNSSVRFCVASGKFVQISSSGRV